jgi:hypothetical protein
MEKIMTNAAYYIPYKSFLEYYSKKICPAFCEIDVCLKADDIISIENAAYLLEVSNTEVKNIMTAHNMSEITKTNFLEIMLVGTSYLCQIFKREIECGSPVSYTPWQVAYIYNLDAYIVNDIFRKLHIELVSTNALPKVFEMIQLQD